MKLMIASDIHGSATCCRQLLDAFDREQAGRLLLLGDLLYHGPRNELPDGYAPKEGSPRGYLVLENGVFSWKTLAGQVFHTLPL